MELQELENIWNEYDKRIDDRIKVNYKFLKKVSLEKTRSLLLPGKVNAILEVIINFLFLGPLAGFAKTHISDLKFSLPALLLALIVLATIAWNIYGFILLSQIDYRSPIITIQKKLEKFKFQNLYRQQRLLYILLPVSQTLFFIVFCKGLININIYDYPKFFILQFLCGIIVVPLISWIVKISPDKKFNAALHFLNDIKEFEKEA
jgi:hypothetical protein